MSEFKEWFREQPFITKWIVILSALIPLTMKLSIIPPYFIVFHWESIKLKFQVMIINFIIMVYLFKFVALEIV